MQWICPLICLMLFGEGVIPQIALEQQEKAVTVLVGGASTFKCSMTGGRMNSYYMYWYRKNQDNTLIFIYREGNYYGSGFQGNFQGEIDQANNKFTLKIVKASVRDKGIYYCGSSMGKCSWDTRAMYFGTGTELSVDPEVQEPSMPSVFVMKNGTNVACLVKDFYPKDVDIHLSPDNHAREVFATANGKFSAVKLGKYEKDLEQINCTVQHNNKTIETSYIESSNKISDPEGCINKTSSQDYHAPTVQIEKVNLLSITMLGLRVLLAKSVAVNIFLTIKCFLH
ncbi:T cell receptor alpha chain MC.7.G5-like [Dromiciops gliroides]|uniref:T cell receptor alpha chain MC.7.G5-like n=1 Tax=Dromiciops gliroides TaxID=33562 RepID=UPI001CC73428|nr:T cell receptor alpha chain MC.7.G5-like [Dromiciops gliroides]